MRGSTLCIIYLCKSLELAGMITLTILAEISLFRVASKILYEDRFFWPLLLTLPICCVAMIYQAFYSQFFTNVRFKFKLSCYSLGKIFCFDGPNSIFCYDRFKEPLTDRCFKKKTLIKWAIQAPIYLLTAFFVHSWKKYKLFEISEQDTFKEMGVFQKDRLLNQYTTSLDQMLVVLAFQHVIVFFARIVLFFCTYIFLLMCEPGNDFPEDYEFENLIISFDYIEYQNKRTSRFKGGQRFKQEYEYTKILRQTKKSAIEAKSQEERKGPIKSLEERLRDELEEKFSFAGLALGACPICGEMLKQKDVCAQFPCHHSHILHELCFEKLCAFTKKNEVKLLCPECRIPTDAREVKILVLSDAKGNKISPEGVNESRIDLAPIYPSEKQGRTISDLENRQSALASALAGDTPEDVGFSNGSQKVNSEKKGDEVEHQQPTQGLDDIQQDLVEKALSPEEGVVEEEQQEQQLDLEQNNTVPNESDKQTLDPDDKQPEAEKPTD